MTTTVVQVPGAPAPAWTTASRSGTFVNGTAFTVQVLNNVGATEAVTESVTANAVGLTLDFTETTGDAIVADSLAFTAFGKRYVDRGGTLYADVNPLTGSGTVAGSINLRSGEATLTWWQDNTALGLNVHACLTSYGQWTATGVFFRTAGSPVAPASLYVQVTAVDGTLVTATTDNNGVVSGPRCAGRINQEMGTVELAFGELVTAAGNETQPWFNAANVAGGQIWRPLEVLPDTLRYNVVILSSLPLDAKILGLDPVRLPSDGRVPGYRPADLLLFHHTTSTTLPHPVTLGATYSAGRDDLAWAELRDSAGTVVASGHYAVDLAAGTVTIAADASLGGCTPPLKLWHRVEERRLAADVLITGEIALDNPLARDWPAGAYVSSCLVAQPKDLQAAVSVLFDQATWTGVWSDSRIGSDATATFNDVGYPIEVGEGTITERWRINFTSTTAFQVIGENVGVIATGTTSTATAPVNTVTGLPYFSIPAGGWGSGWAAGNQLRLDTVGANSPFWVARPVLSGASLSGDEFTLGRFGDVD